jgi:mannose-1-phosphate guanylyltransferase
LWPIVLAGGEGRRMRPFIRSWLGEERPKQYCTFVGSRSMLRHTWDRACALAPASQVVTVVARGHARFLAEAGDRAPGPLLEQPVDCGTAAGVLLPVSLVAARDPQAVVLLLPADHFIYPESRFVALAERACAVAAEAAGRLVVLAASASGPETDYGWILPAPSLDDAPLQPVARFEEKPEAARATELFRQGALWSTMVVAVRVDTVWRLAETVLPGLMRPFRALRRTFRHPASELPEVRVAEALARAYRRVPRADFSRDLVQRAADQRGEIQRGAGQRAAGLRDRRATARRVGPAAFVMPMTGVDWSDWGRPERVAETLLRLGKRPAFLLATPRERGVSKPVLPA